MEAERAGELVRNLGVEHHIVSLDWGKGKGGAGGRGLKLHVPPRSLVIMEKKHLSMLNFCQRKKIRTLMISHHLEDQIGKPIRGNPGSPLTAKHYALLVIAKIFFYRHTAGYQRGVIVHVWVITAYIGP